MPSKDDGESLSSHSHLMHGPLSLSLSCSRSLSLARSLAPSHSRLNQHTSNLNGWRVQCNHTLTDTTVCACAVYHNGR
eukprot:1200722-Rhodomonas_salina.1